MVEKMSHFILVRFILNVITLVDGNCWLDKSGLRPYRINLQQRKR